MKLIVGLGNPGRIYKNSRHNIGFSVVRVLAKAYRVTLKRDKDTFSLTAKARIKGQNVILGIPLTFMNLSGNAVKALLKKYKLDLKDLLAVCDDLDLEFGRLKVKAAGSSGGQRGLKSIIDVLGSQDFCRLRIGIGKPSLDFRGISKYILSAFTKQESQQLKGIVGEAVDGCRIWLAKGIDKTMDIVNRRSR